MKIIDIYDGGGYASAPDNVLADRLRALAWRGESVGAVRRRGHTADILTDTPGISVRTTRFGLGFRLTVPMIIRRLAGEADRFVVVTHSMRHAEQALMAKRAMADKRMAVVVELADGTPSDTQPRARFVVGEADLLMFHSTADRDSFVAPWGELAERKTTVLQPGVSVPAESKEADESKELVIIWGGRITADCGLDRVVEAMGAEYRTPVKLIVAGQGEARASVPVLKRARALGLDARVEWLGDAALAPELLRRADAAILPSAKSPDNFIVGAMAMASGLPLILADDTRMSQLGQDAVNSIFVDFENTDCVAGAFRLLAGNPALRRELGQHARAKAEAQYDLGFHLDQLLSLYSELLV